MKQPIHALELRYRKANFSDLETIIQLLSDDELGKTREKYTPILDQNYIDAFHRIEADPNHYLMIVEAKGEIIGTCHLIFIPSITFKGSTRMEIEAVRISQKYRGQNIGEWLMNTALELARERDATIIQLTTNKRRERAKQFYEKLGFQASHEGMKLLLGNAP